MIKEEIFEILTHHFHPLSLEVIDDSLKHAKHQSNMSFNKGTIETHFCIKIYSIQLNNMKLLEAHKAIYSKLDAIMARIHALQIILIKD